MNFYEASKETVINNEFDYSNIIPTSDCITKLVYYCDNIYNNFLNIIAEDEQKNERLKYEYKNYKYGKSYGMNFSILIHEKNYNIINCNNYDSYLRALNNKQLTNVNSLEISLDLNYKRGSTSDLKSHENSFKITFRPYEIKFIRKSNYNEEDMDKIEKTINTILNQFPKANTIFYTK